MAKSDIVEAVSKRLREVAFTLPDGICVFKKPHTDHTIADEITAAGFTNGDGSPVNGGQVGYIRKTLGMGRLFTMHPKTVAPSPAPEPEAPPTPIAVSAAIDAMVTSLIHDVSGLKDRVEKHARAINHGSKRDDEQDNRIAAAMERLATIELTVGDFVMRFNKLILADKFTSNADIRHLEIKTTPRPGITA